MVTLNAIIQHSSHLTYSAENSHQSSQKELFRTIRPFLTTKIQVIFRQAYKLTCFSWIPIQHLNITDVLV